MASKHITEFFLEKKAKATSSNVDWSAKRDQWIQAVENLYDTVANDYLGSDDIAGIVTVDRTRTKSVQEQSIGSYSIHEMILAVGDEEVLFSPKGVNVLGAKGRVDVRGDRGEATLVRQLDDQWSLVLSRTPKLQLVPLSDESFLAMLRSVMR